MNNNLLLGDFVQKLYAQKCLKTRFNVLTQYARKLGFEDISYTCVPNVFIDIGLQPAFEKTDTFSPGLMYDYEDKGLQRSDFAIRKVSEGETRVLDWRQYEATDLISDAERETIKLAHDKHGIENALTVPTMSGEMGVAGVSVLSEEKGSSYELLKRENLSALNTMCQVFHSSCFSESKIPREFLLPFIESLTDKEKKILRYMASGKPFKNIEEHTQISETYAHNALSSFRKKLGGITKNELLYVIGVINLLDHI